MKQDLNSMTVNDWVEYTQTLHHREIELSLERVRDVYLRLYPNGLTCKIISLSGTNGKGSTAELCASIYRQAGYHVGKFTSPHLVHFNERININGVPVSDDDLLSSFVRIERIRNDVPITFFEFGTLLAIDLFERAGVDIALMEVGLGGRLDSVNILDCDIAITTSIAIDHTSWLGDTVEKIAYEKAGIARPEKPYIVGLDNPPETLLEHAEIMNADLYIIGTDFQFKHEPNQLTWSWRSINGGELKNLPLPFSQTGVQLSNCALALQAISQLQEFLPVKEVQIKNGIQMATLAGRCQVIQRKPLIILDVSHNEASVTRLADFIRAQAEFENVRTCSKIDRVASGNFIAPKIVAICGMLKDKEIADSLKQLTPIVDEWHTATIHNERGASSAEVAAQLASLTDVPIVCYDAVEQAYSIAINTLTEDDCLVVFGSFHIVGDILNTIT